VEFLVLVGVLDLTEDVAKAVFECGIGESKRDHLARELVSFACGHLAVHGEPRVGFPIGDIHELVQPRGAKQARQFGSEVIGHVVLFQGRSKRSPRSDDFSKKQ
jgi:hypothetical protein